MPSHKQVTLVLQKTFWAFFELPHTPLPSDQAGTNLLPDITQLLSKVQLNTICATKALTHALGSIPEHSIPELPISLILSPGLLPWKSRGNPILK